MLADITKKENADDDIRLPVYEALESGCLSFGELRSFCSDRIRFVLKKYTALRDSLLSLLKSIKQNRIIVVESGYAGTIPMLLSALDDRVDFRLYSTAPYLYSAYSGRIFCRKYEDIRKFETVYSQDLLIRYSSFRDGKFFVNITDDNEIRRLASEEISVFLPI